MNPELYNALALGTVAPKKGGQQIGMALPIMLLVPCGLPPEATLAYLEKAATELRQFIADQDKPKVWKPGEN